MERGVKLIEYKELTYDEETILDLYKENEWKSYIDNKHIVKTAFDNSLTVLGAYDNDKLVGFIRVVGDKLTIVFIQDLIVTKEFQGQGIGKALVKQITEMYKDCFHIILITDDSERNKAFYQKCGFKEIINHGSTTFKHFNK